MLAVIEGAIRAAEAQRRFPNWILWLLGVAFAVWAIGSMVDAFPWQGSGTVPAVQPDQQTQIGPAVQRPAAQPVQPVPQQNVAVAPANLPLLKWEKIGEASNGDQVMALPIPWDQLFRYESQGGDPVIWKWLRGVNPPQGYEVPGTFAGYLIKNDRIIMYGYASQDAHTGSYWKAEENLSVIEGLSQ